MCLNIYIGSKNELPEIEWNKNKPGLYISRVTHLGTISMLDKILVSNFLYTTGSFMGCSCGFSYGKVTKEDENGDHLLRVRDVNDFVDYLRFNKDNNQLKLFCTYWNDLLDSYEIETFQTPSLTSIKFDFVEDKILLVN